MMRYIRIVLVLVAISSVVLFDSIVLWAQPFGISSPKQRESQYQTLSSENARFVFGQISDSDKDQFMLDTLTGRLWRIAESGEIGLFLRAVPYRTAEGEYKPLPKTITELESKKEMH